MNPPFLPFIPLNGHLIKGFAIFLKRIFLGHPVVDEYQAEVSTGVRAKVIKGEQSPDSRTVGAVKRPVKLRSNSLYGGQTNITHF